ncbi:MAG TPA: hypothetical protein DIU39_07225 [Flavobacteriales bacterium]|nr:hypothetical protein [Flavobacteriales bacterium]|tara:strand:- start:77529 stop:77936 length:408 start_codon:yes stop_codon:yes gene_type:complete
MNYVNPVNIAIISLNNSTTEYYTQFFNLKQYDNILHLDKRSFNIEKFKNFQPEIILIDDYFNCDNNEEIINKIKKEFQTIPTYYLAPQCVDCFNDYEDEKVYFFKDNFNESLIEHFNKTLLKLRIKREITKNIAI